ANISGLNGELDGTPTLSDGRDTTKTVETYLVTVKRPKGIAENVLVGFDKFIFPIDFIVLDMPKDIKTPLILGRPFLSTAHAKIDVFKRKTALRVGNDKVVFQSDKHAELRRDQVEDLGPTIMEVLEDMDAYRDEGMGDVIFEKPFYKEIGVKARWPLLKVSAQDELEVINITVIFRIRHIHAYDTESRMELYIEGKENRRMMLNSVNNGLLIWPTEVDKHGTDLAKITKKGSKPDKKKYEIVKSAQKPDPKTFYVH
nr:hypothetical protein [Tanacetum cinerariifolium]